MVVFGSETFVRFSCGITGALSVKAGLGGFSPTWAPATAAGSATRTVRIPMRCRARPNVEGRATASARVTFDRIILAEPFLKHSPADYRGATGLRALRQAGQRADPGNERSPIRQATARRRARQDPGRRSPGRIPGRVAPGDCSPRAPADPYVPSRAYGSSRHELATGRYTEWIATGG